ncbi:MAG: NAD(P)H-hydrate dehydratase [Phycisphaerae bacterium]|nr:NAD(P)H-hydrate dehydratase [Phycisphaerae bacterium]
MANIITDLPKLPKRPIDSYKGNFGKILIIGGCRNMPGAPAISAKAALRSGAGLVKMAVPEGIQMAIVSNVPCATSEHLQSDSDGRISAASLLALEAMLPNHDVVVIGPGLTTSHALHNIVSRIALGFAGPVVMDADALNNLCEKPERLKSNCIFTPHPGEFKKLWEAYFDEPMPEARREAAQKLSLRTNAIVVLKGNDTIVTDGNNIYANTTGNPGMATAGSGDVLAGIIGALAGNQFAKFNNFQSAILGVYIHGLAGDIAAEKFGQTGMIATDIIDSLPEAWQMMEAD